MLRVIFGKTKRRWMGHVLPEDRTGQADRTGQDTRDRTGQGQEKAVGKRPDMTMTTMTTEV